MQLPENLATWVDMGIIVLIILSLLVGLVRGLVKEVISLITWLAAAGFAALYFRPLSEILPFGLQSEVARLIIAAAIIFFSVLIIGAFINYLFTSAVSMIGLRGVDHFFGAVFGVLRGALIVILALILVDLTNLPSQAWWQESKVIPLFLPSVAKAKTMIPKEFSDYLEKGDETPLISP